LTLHGSSITVVVVLEVLDAPVDPVLVAWIVAIGWCLEGHAISAQRQVDQVLAADFL
jgi:hypothetical protein